MRTPGQGSGRPGTGAGIDRMPGCAYLAGQEAADGEVRDVERLLVVVAGPEGEAGGAVERRALGDHRDRAALVDGGDPILRVHCAPDRPAAIDRDPVDPLERRILDDDLDWRRPGEVHRDVHDASEIQVGDDEVALVVVPGDAVDAEGEAAEGRRDRVAREQRIGAEHRRVPGSVDRPELPEERIGQDDRAVILEHEVVREAVRIEGGELFDRARARRHAPEKGAGGSRREAGAGDVDEPVGADLDAGQHGASGERHGRHGDEGAGLRIDLLRSRPKSSRRSRFPSLSEVIDSGSCASAGSKLTTTVGAGPAGSRCRHEPPAPSTADKPAAIETMPRKPTVFVIVMPPRDRCVSLIIALPIVQAPGQHRATLLTDETFARNGFLPGSQAPESISGLLATRKRERFACLESSLQKRADTQ